MNNHDILQEDFMSYEYEDTITLLVIYDITDNKKRTRLAKHLLGYGYRVQKSAFECTLTKEKYQKMMKAIPRYCTNDDSIRIYRHNSNVSVQEFGKPKNDATQAIYFI